jgi:hypothetical protein
VQSRIAGRAVSALFLLLLGTSLQAADYSGTWVGTTEVPDQGTDQVTLVLKKTGKTYGVVLTDSLGMVAKEEIKDVTVTSDGLTFHFSLTDGSAMIMRLKVAGDKMTGQWEHPDGTVGAITLQRSKG